MHENNQTAPVIPVPSRDVLTEILRNGAQRLLGQTIDAEVEAWIERHAELKDDDGRQQVVKNGHHPTRTLVTGVGPVEVTQPRVWDRRIVGRSESGEAVDANGQVVERFCSAILPRYLRKTKAIEELIPWLYLKGISTGDFSEALQALVGPQAAGLSAATVTRLMTSWQDEYEAWNRRSLEGRHYVYVWADGIHFNIRLAEDRQCILVLMGATADVLSNGRIAVTDVNDPKEPAAYQAVKITACEAWTISLIPKHFVAKAFWNHIIFCQIMGCDPSARFLGPI